MRHRPILIVGESLIDIVATHRPGEHQPSGRLAGQRGSRTRPPRTRSFAADAPRSGQRRRHLESEGVDLIEADTPSNQRTSAATVTLNGDGSAKYAFNIEWSLPSANGPWRLRDHPYRFDSCIPAPGSGDRPALFEQYRGLSLLSFDPNIRPQLLPDHVPLTGPAE